MAASLVCSSNSLSVQMHVCRLLGDCQVRVLSRCFLCLSGGASSSGRLFSFGVISDIQYANIPDGFSFKGVPRFYRCTPFERPASELAIWMKVGHLDEYVDYRDDSRH